MATKFEKTGNYLVLTTSSKVEVFPTKEIYYQQKGENIMFNKLRGGAFANAEGYNFNQTSAEGTVTINTVTPTKASGTITLAGALAADTATVNGLLYTAVAGAKADNTEFSIDVDDNTAATDLADSINNDVRAGTLNDLTSTAGAAIVTSVTTVGGTVGNATTLVSSNGARLAVSGATFTGGLDDAEISGIVVDAIQIMSGAETSVEDTGILATQVASNITAHTSIPNYTAIAVAGLITITSVIKGTAINGFVVASTAVKATKTDTNMSGATADITDTTGTTFTSIGALITFLKANTGA